jgi:epoxyqueuosine reductase
LILWDETMQHSVLTEKLNSLAEGSGLDVLGFADASEFKGYRLSHSPRRDPKLSLPDAKTIIVAGVYIGGVTLPIWQDPRYGRTSRLYLSGYFLDMVKPLAPLVELLTDQGFKAILCEGTTDEGSILPLKLAAVRAGLGWQGKHSLLISKRYGTFLALGGIITDAELQPNTKEEPNRCRNCDKCQQACPLGALETPYVLNRNGCMSYCLAVENLPDEVQAVMENRIGDCEICQDACPWNKKHLENPLATETTLSFQKKAADWEKTCFLPDLSKISEGEFRRRFDWLNTGYAFDIFQRNVLLALDNVRQLK